jgi:hypothetical protein
MRRLAGNLFTLWAAASLALCVVVAAWLLGAGPSEVAFPYGGARWRVARSGVGVVVDNRPQLKSEADAERAAEDAFEQRLADVAERSGAVEDIRRRMAFYPDTDKLRQLDEARWELRRESDALLANHTRARAAAARTWPAGRVIPRAAVLAGLAALPAAWLATHRLAARRRRRLVARGACAACGYDLRASPGRCPECGATASRP